MTAWAVANIVMSVFVCVSLWSVCLSVREGISGTTRAIFTKFLCMLHMAVAQSSSVRVTKSQGERGNFFWEGVLSHWQCTAQHRPRSVRWACMHTAGEVWDLSTFFLPATHTFIHEWNEPSRLYSVSIHQMAPAERGSAHPITAHYSVVAG